MKTRFVLITFFCLVLFSAIPATARDTWVNVRSKNFFLVGNASEKEIRAVATKLEQFRETFRQVFPRAKFNNSVQTNVVVFKSASSYKPFKPKRADGKADEWVAGYFQAGEDVNYITLSTEGEKEDTYGTIFHEYVHFLLRNNLGDSNIPPWFNEGLAEYYQTFQIKDDIKATLGNVQSEHLSILQRTQLIPLKTLFAVDYYQLYQNGSHSRTIFYAQSWALMHYLIQGNKGANLGSLDKFLTLLRNKVAPKTAFQQAFGYDYATMEAALKKYVAQRTFMATLVTFPQKLVFDTEMTAAPVSEGEANAYLGDLLYHTGEYTDAETYLKNALAQDANSAMANTSLGLVKMKQRKFDEAKKYLETAVAAGQKNHLAHYNYAYVLSRESMDEFNYVTSFPADKVKKMRESLIKAIELNPSFGGSYSLLAFIGMVNNENLDEAVAYLKKGIAAEPGKQEYVLQTAEIYLRQQKFKEAREIAENLARTASEPEIHSRAESILRSIEQYEDAMAQNEAMRKQYESGANRPGRPAQRKTLSDEEIKKLQEDSVIDGLNRLLQKPKEGEKQAVGYVQKITCAGGMVTYSVKTESEALTLTSKDFASLDLLAMTPEAEALALGCAAKIQNILTVVVYRPGKDAKAKSTLLSVAFVPKTLS